MALENYIAALVATGGCIAVIFGAFLAASDRVSWWKSMVKTLSTAALALAAALYASGGGAGPTLIALGLGLGALGDFLLSRNGDRAFLGGMAAFALGHLAYVAALWTLMQVTGTTAGQWIIGAGLVMLVASTEFWLAPHTGALRWPVRGYGIVIGAMGLTALFLGPVEGRETLWLGAALFILSDLMLALRLFVVKDTGKARALSYALWPAYWGGQFLILIAAFSIWPRVG